MKLKYPIIAVLTLASVLVVGCKFFGANPSPPTAVEHTFFDVQTNLVPRVETQVRTYNETNRVTIYETNTLNQIVTKTNEMIVIKYESVPVTNFHEEYVLTTKTNTVAAVQAVGTGINLVAPGAGGLFIGILGGLLTMWGKLRSAKTTGSVLAQDIETMREFLKTIPDGAKYDQVLVDFMKKHQEKAGVLDQVLSLLPDILGNLKAKNTVLELQNALKALK